MGDRVDDENAPGRFRVSPTSSDHFAWVRTRLSAERTMLAWARTAIALIGFGFTIVKFFESMNALEGLDAPLYPHAARYLGLTLIASGTLSLGIAIWQYVGIVRYLWKPDFRAIAGMHETPGHSPTLAAAAVLILIGVYAFSAILFRIG